jgi:hypothetical protein
MNPVFDAIVLVVGRTMILGLSKSNWGINRIIRFCYILRSLNDIKGRIHTLTCCNSIVNVFYGG